MPENDQSQYECENCHHDVDVDAAFCPYCGGIYTDYLRCEKHGMTDADGVCVICGKAYCSRCGGWVNSTFRCNEHAQYEIISDMACVFAASDEMHADYLAQVLETEGLHPFLFQNKMRPNNLSFSAIASTINEEMHRYFETRIMVPFGEVIAAEQILKDIETSESGDILSEDNY
ncbi:hypothetical protein JW960_17345 [candidate division KSB1 bacterium]|nr:hypothetical protein [candidate division KSB1 bacterium]